MWLSKTTSLLERIVRPLSFVFNSIGGIGLSVMMIMTALDVILRDTLNTPLVGTVDLTIYFMAIAVAFGLAHCGLQKGHIVADVMVSKLPRRPKAILFIATTFVSFVVVSLMAWQSFVFMKVTYGVGIKSVMLNLPAFPFIGAVGLGFVLYGLVLLRDFFQAIAHEVRK